MSTSPEIADGDESAQCHSHATFSPQVYLMNATEQHAQALHREIVDHNFADCNHQSEWEDQAPTWSVAALPLATSSHTTVVLKCCRWSVAAAQYPNAVRKHGNFSRRDFPDKRAFPYSCDRSPPEPDYSHHHSRDADRGVVQFH